LDDFLVGHGEGKVRQAVRPHPTPIGAVEGLRLAPQVTAFEDVQADAEMRIAVADGDQLSAYLYLHAQLFADFAAQAIGQGLARLALPARKLQQPP